MKILVEVDFPDFFVQEFDNPEIIPESFAAELEDMLSHTGATVTIKGPE